MLIEKVLEEDKRALKKSFVDLDGCVYVTGDYGMHELLALTICRSKGWIDWNNYFDKAEDYLIHNKAFIKVADYEEFGYAFHYVSFSSKFLKIKKIRRLAELIARSLKIQIIYEEETS